MLKVSLCLFFKAAAEIDQVCNVWWHKLPVSMKIAVIQVLCYWSYIFHISDENKTTFFFNFTILSIKFKFML